MGIIYVFHLLFRYIKYREIAIIFIFQLNQTLTIGSISDCIIGTTPLSL